MSGPGGGRRRADIVFAVAMLALCAAVWWGSLDLPPAMLEPIGPAVFPQAASIVLALLSLAVLAAAALRSGVRPSEAVAAQRPAHARRPGLAVAMVALTVAYLGVMEAGLLGFRDATVTYLLVLGMALFGFELRRLGWVVAIALAIGVGSHAVFTRLFFIDLP